MSTTKNKTLYYTLCRLLLRRKPSQTLAIPHCVAEWYKCLCKLSGVRLDKWMWKSSAMNFGLHSDQTCGGQTNIADWYLSCPTTECWERSDCFTVGVSARVANSETGYPMPAFVISPAFVTRKRKDYYLLTSPSKFTKFATPQNPDTFHTRCNWSR